MHILATDASTNSLHWFMDSSTLRKNINKLDMIKTSSRIDSKLITRIGEPVMTGNRCSAPPPCRVFSSGVTSFQMTEGFRKHQQRNLLETKNDCRASEDYQPMSPNERSRFSRNKSYDATDTSTVSSKGESNLTGYINGFILNTAQEEHITDSENDERQRYNEYSKDRRKEYVNKNSNNNSMPPINSVVENRKSSNSESEDKTDHNGALRYFEKHKAIEKYRHSHNIAVSNEKTMNGSNILERMYASFGSKGGDTSRLLWPSERCNTSDAETKSISPSHSSHVCCSRPNNDTNRIRTDTCSPTNRHRRNSSSNKSHSDTNKRNSNIPHSNTTNAINVSEKISYHTGEKSIHEKTTRPPKHRNTLHKKQMKRSPVHSIDSLLSDRQQLSNDSYQSRQNWDNITEKLNKTTYPMHNMKDAALTRNSFAKHARCSQSSLQAGNTFEQDMRRTQSSPHSCSEQRNLRSPANSENDEMYNEKSREIFRREKEIIENSIRHPNPHTQHCSSAQDIPLTIPYWLNTNALAALQANILGSIPQNAQALNAVSLAAAASANPMLLGVNPCLVNPYLLSTLTGGDATIAAYQQAMTQGILQNYSALKAGTPVNQALYPGVTSQIYGNIPIPDSSAITAAFSASMRHNPPGLYPNHTFPYIPFAPQMDSNEIMGRDESAPRCESSSPNIVSPQLQTPERTSSLENESRYNKRHHLSSDTPYQSIPPPKRTFAERPIHKPTAPHLPPRHRSFRENSYITKSQAKNKISSSKLSSQLKRKSPVSESSTTPKKRPLNITLDMTHTNSFSPTALLNPINSKDDDSVNTSSPASKSSMHSDNGIPCRPASYKNLTRERRLVANARERTRVHTISSAFDELRQQIPSYSCSQKLSKLAILRIACSYIQSLSVLSGRDAEGTFKESVDQCTRVLQAESRARSRRKSNKAQIEWEVANYEKPSSVFDGDIHENPNSPMQSSLETTPSVSQRNTAEKSLSSESVAQVHDERDYHGNDDSSLHTEFSRDDYPINTTRSETFNDSCDQSYENVLADNAPMSDNSLDAITEKINRSSVNDTGGDTWTSDARSPHRNNISNMSTWRCDDKTEAESCSINRDDGQSSSSICSSDKDVEKTGHQPNVEDQHIDVINVED